MLCLVQRFVYSISISQVPVFPPVPMRRNWGNYGTLDRTCDSLFLDQQRSRTPMEASFGYENLSARELAETLDRLSQELAAGQAQQQERHMQEHAAIGRLKDMRGALSDLAWEIEELEQRLGDLQAQREGPDDPLVEREMVSIRGRRAALEEQLLTQMLQIDELAANIATEEQLLATANDEWAVRETTLQNERARVAALLAQKTGRSE
jgi:chromosome segregation ATPase